jgi:hypothetical protein
MATVPRKDLCLLFKEKNVTEIWMYFYFFFSFWHTKTLVPHSLDLKRNIFSYILEWNPTCTLWGLHRTGKEQSYLTYVRCLQIMQICPCVLQNNLGKLADYSISECTKLRRSYFYQDCLVKAGLQTLTVLSNMVNWLWTFQVPHSRSCGPSSLPSVLECRMVTSQREVHLFLSMAWHPMIYRHHFFPFSQNKEMNALIIILGFSCPTKEEKD